MSRGCHFGDSDRQARTVATGNVSIDRDRVKLLTPFLESIPGREGLAAELRTMESRSCELTPQVSA